MICGMQPSAKLDESIVRPHKSALILDAYLWGRRGAVAMGQENSLAVTLGTHVEVELIDEAGASDHLAFDLVTDERADFANGFLGSGTPLAQAIMDKVAGAVITYRLGDVVSVRIVQVTPEVRLQEEDVAAKRQAVIQQAVAESERISDMVFALAVGSKWGDYDPGEPQE